MIALIDLAAWIIRILAGIGMCTLIVTIIFVIMIQAHMDDWPEYDEEEGDEWP